MRTVHLCPESRLGKRLLRSHTRRLERCLRTGHRWPIEEWVESYQNSRLLGSLARRLIWEDSRQAFCWYRGAWRKDSGKEVNPYGSVRLWHPADGPTTKIKPRKPLFAQAEREVYLKPVFQPFLARQYQLMALLRQRDWNHRAVGRYRKQCSAVLRIKNEFVVLNIERATAFGPFSKDGTAIEARITGLESQPDWSKLSPRFLSEALRDLALFQRVAQLTPKQIRESTPAED